MSAAGAAHCEQNDGSGPTAAGKTSVGHELAARLDRSIHLDGDTIQSLIVSGSIRMDIPPPPGALDQLHLRQQAALMVASLYRRAGFDAILTDNLFAGETRRFLGAALSTEPDAVHFVMLDPSIEAIQHRYSQRPGGGYSASLTPQLLQGAVLQTSRVGLWLDTTDQTTSQTVDEILERLHEAALTSGQLR